MYNKLQVKIKYCVPGLFLIYDKNYFQKICYNLGKVGERRGTPEEQFTHKVHSRYNALSLTTLALGLKFTKANKTIIIELLSVLENKYIV